MACNRGVGQAPTGGSYACRLVSAAGIETFGRDCRCRTVFRGAGMGPRQAIAPGPRSLVAQIAGATKAIVTAAMSITLVRSRVGLGLIVVAARQFGVHIGSADFTGIAGNKSTPP